MQVAVEPTRCLLTGLVLDGDVGVAPLPTVLAVEPFGKTLRNGTPQPLQIFELERVGHAAAHVKDPRDGQLEHLATGREVVLPKG